MLRGGHVPLSLARVRTHAAALALGIVFLAPAGAQAQWRTAPPARYGGEQPLLQPRPTAVALTPSERIAQAGPLYGTSTDLQLIAFGAALLYGGYRLKEADHPYLGASVGFFGLLSFVFGFTDLIDPHRYPAPAPRDTARAP
jgi:hypothetical protein